MLNALIEQHRLIYNLALEQRIKTYQETGKGIGYNQQWAYFRNLRRENPNTLGAVNASSVQHTLRRLDKAFSVFFRRLKAGEKAGFPRFRARTRFNTIEYTYGDGCKLRMNEQGRVSCYIQNVGEIRLCYHRAIPKNARIKHAWITRRNGRWYVSLAIELPDTLAQREPRGKQVGMDVGLKSLAALSTGERIENPRWLRENLARLRRLQRHASRQVKGSHRQKKTYHQIARLHERIANQRVDYLHKVSKRIVEEYDLIAIEDLTLSFMNRNPHLALSAHDAGFGLLRQMLEYKAESAGIPVIAVRPNYTSQVCSGCGSVVPKGLSVRIHECSHCGLVLDRDVNAARNILSLALQNPPGRGGQAETWAAAPCVA
jgi:putative transposase